MTDLKHVLIWMAVSLAVSPYDLIWSDEFEGFSLNASNWNIEATDQPYNNEMQAYTIDNNFYIEDGFLHIIAKKEQWESKNFTSARLNTQNKRDFLYGKFEARMKMSIGQGLWPAFWMLPSGKDGQWPRAGEIDIMETVGSNTTFSFSTIHYGNSVSEHTFKGDAIAIDGGYSDDFHVYSCQWQPGNISFYLDGQLFSQRNPQECQPWPFDAGNSFYLVLNLAVGGDWPGPPDNSTEFPSEFVIDWVRVYQTSSEMVAKLLLFGMKEIALFLFMLFSFYFQVKY